MTLDQIDQALAEWRTRLALAGGSLLELDDIAAYQRLRGGAGRPAATLTGLTRTRVGPALAAIDGLWQSLQQLTEIVKRAEGLRASLGRLWAPEGERRQIEALLQGASVQLPSVETPFAQRGLLSVVEQTQAITPEALLSRMTRDFAVAKETVLALESAWSRLEPILAAAGRDAASLQAMADRLGIDAQPDMDAVRREVDALRDRVVTDPLGVDADFTTGLAPLLGRTRTRLAALEQEQDRLEADLHRAQALLTELDTLRQACQATLRECHDKIEAAPPSTPTVPPELAAWLQSVETACRQRQWKPARLGLDRWLQSAESAHKELTGFCTLHRAALERREELRGLLSALQAKAQAQAARGGPPDPAVSALAREAERLLHGRPTPLERAAALVSEYERRLLSG